MTVQKLCMNWSLNKTILSDMLCRFQTVSSAVIGYSRPLQKPCLSNVQSLITILSISCRYSELPLPLSPVTQDKYTNPKINHWLLITTSSILCRCFQPSWSFPLIIQVHYGRNLLVFILTISSTLQMFQTTLSTPAGYS